jgi:hypothetical protein
MTTKGEGSAVKVRSGVRAGGTRYQHNRRLGDVKVSSQVRAGGVNMKHNRRALTVA